MKKVYYILIPLVLIQLVMIASCGTAGTQSSNNTIIGTWQITDHSDYQTLKLNQAERIILTTRNNIPVYYEFTEEGHVYLIRENPLWGTTRNRWKNWHIDEDGYLVVSYRTSRYDSRLPEDLISWKADFTVNTATLTTNIFFSSNRQDYPGRIIPGTSFIVYTRANR